MPVKHLKTPWTDFSVGVAGYFTSRATSKGWIREATAYLQAARQLEVFTAASRPSGEASDGGFSKGASTDSLEEAVSLLQHHDAITGTEKQHVADDYHLRLARGAAPLHTQTFLSAQWTCLITDGMRPLCVPATAEVASGVLYDRHAASECKETLAVCDRLCSRVCGSPF